MRRSMMVLWSLFPVLLATRPLEAATYFVNPDGNDTNAGSREQPWATLRHAGRQARPGDVIKVRTGVYRQTAVITNCQGTEDQPITFEADGGSVTVDGSLLLTDWQAENGNRYSKEVGTQPVYLVWAGDRLLLGPTYRESFAKVRRTKDTLQRGQCLREGTRLYLRLFDDTNPNRGTIRVSVGHCILLQGCAYTVWRGIGTAWGLDGYKLENGSAFNVITDAELRHHGQGILENKETVTISPCQFNTFRRLHIHHVGVTKFDHGIYTSGIRTRILNCRFDHITGAAIHGYPQPIQAEFDGNFITDPLPPYQPEHFVGDKPPEPTSHYTAIIGWGPGGHRVSNNLIAGPFAEGINVRSNGCWVVNNTIALTNGTGLIFDAKGRDYRVVNNILRTAGHYIAGAEPAVLDANGYFSGKGWNWEGQSYATLAELQKFGKEKHGVEVDPQFVAPEKMDFRLSRGSPMRNVGLLVGAPVLDLRGIRRPQGKGYDLGAYGQPEESN